MKRRKTQLIHKLKLHLGRIPTHVEMVKCGKIVTTSYPGRCEYQWNEKPLFIVVVE
jgi:hypothetical protein